MAQTAERAEKFVGGGVARKEDPELITGQANFTENITIPGMLWMAVTRSPFAHARITSVDTTRAKEMPGVVAAFSGRDLADEWADSLPCAWPVTEDIRMPKHWPVAQDKARFAGDPVAVVVANTRAQAKDASEAIDVDYEPLEVVADIEGAMNDSAPKVHDEFDDNSCFTWTLENGDQSIFDSAPVVVKERYWHPRLIPNAIEPRAIVVQPAPAQGELTMWSATQIPHILRTTLSVSLGIPESKLRIIAPDVGGGFGSKLQVYEEEAIMLALARRLGRPLKWVEERSENYLATHHGRGVMQDMEVAADENGKVQGFRAKLVADMGAYLRLVTPGIPILGGFLYSGVYDAKAYSFECTGVFTNLTPTDAYRGAGRPEATYAVERIMDALARRLDKDPAELRRMNFIEPFDEARESPAGLQYDSGDYHEALDKALAMIGYEDLRREQKERRDSGDKTQLGIGLSSYIEMCGLAPSQVLASLRYGAGGWEAATVRCHPTGKVTVVTGASPHGQGHETSWSQIVADELGVHVDDIEVLHGDTAVSPQGMDSYGSRSLSVGGVAVYNAAQKVVAKAKKIAAHELEAAEEDIEFADGKLRVKGAPDRSKGIADIAFSAWTAHDLPEGLEPGLEESFVYDPPNFTFPSGTHVCAVEIDTETGQLFIRKYVAVDDCGNVINPVIVDGQVHGGIAQGIAEAQYEEAIYDDTGNLTTGNMGYYRIPSAAELPSFETDRTITPSTTNPLGVKGVGEAGTIASPPCVLNAVVNALEPLGVTHIDKPASAERVWKAINDARGGTQ
ncbi:molybdopterin-dependent oxidoreductase [soil metagenome]